MRNEWEFASFEELFSSLTQIVGDHYSVVHTSENYSFFIKLLIFHKVHAGILLTSRIRSIHFVQLAFVTIQVILILTLFDRISCFKIWVQNLNQKLLQFD